MAKLTNDARTVLRSRVRRHPDIDKHVPTGGVSSLSNGDLVQIALLLQLDVPTAQELNARRSALASGLSGPEAIGKADQCALDRGHGGAGMQRITLLDGYNHVQDESDTTTEDDTADDVDTGAPAAAKEPEHAVKARERVKEIQGMMGRGDFQGYADALNALALDAFKPAPVINAPARVSFVDPSKIKGHVPSTSHTMTMAKAGIAASIRVNDDATALPVYDAPDAPAIDPGYIWPDSAGAVLATLADGDNVFLWGPAGTGKTTFAQQVAAHWKRPFVRISCDDQTEAATLMGMTVPAKDGGTEWQDGQLTAAIRKPGTVILVDEPTVARPGALFVLQAVLDDNRALHIPDTGEVIPVAPDVLFVLADNTNGTGDATGQYEATRILNRATLDRMALTVRLDYMTPEQETKALQSRAGIDAKRAARLCKFAALTRTKSDEGHLSHGVGLRRLVSLAKRLRAGIEPAAAFQMAVLETAPFDDREPLRQLWAAEMPNGAL